MDLRKVKKEVETEKTLECWARRTNHFPKKVKRLLFRRSTTRCGVDVTMRYHPGSNETKCTIRS